MAGILLCISIGLWYSAHRAILDIDETITTIAMPDQVLIRNYAEANNISEEEVLQSIIDTVYNSELLQFDRRRIYNATAENISPVPHRAYGMGFDPALAPFLPQAVSAFVVTYERTTFAYMPSWRQDEETGAIYEVMSQMRVGNFLVDDVVHLQDGYEIPRRLQIPIPLRYDGTSYIVSGEQYIMMGHFAPGAGFPRGFSSLFIELPDVPQVDYVIDYIPSAREIDDYLDSWTWWWYEPSADSFPMPIVTQALEREPTSEDGNFGFIKVENSLEETFAGKRWAQMTAHFDIAEISADSFQVLTTNDANSLIRLNQNRHLVYDGRLISADEYRAGARVALVSQHFASHNGLSVGDTMALELYALTFGTAEIEYTPGYLATPVLTTAWIPSLYHPDLDVTDPIEYTIVGIINVLLVDRTAYAIPRNTIIIPDNSFEGVGGMSPRIGPGLYVPEHVPLLDEGLIVANGHIEEVRAIINGISYGYGELFRFFDQGFRSVMSALSNLRFGMTWILVLVILVWISVIFLFSMFYTARKRREASVLYALGIGRGSRFSWVFVQSALLIIFSLAISLGVALPATEYILEMAAEVAEAFTDEFRDLTLSDAADAGLRARIPLVRPDFVIITTAAIGSALLLAVTGIMSARINMFKSLGAGKEES